MQDPGTCEGLQRLKPPPLSRLFSTLIQLVQKYISTGFAPSIFKRPGSGVHHAACIWSPYIRAAVITTIYGNTDGRCFARCCLTSGTSFSIYQVRCRRASLDRHTFLSRGHERITEAESPSKAELIITKSNLANQNQTLSRESGGDFGPACVMRLMHGWETCRNAQQALVAP